MKRTLLASSALLACAAACTPDPAPQPSQPGRAETRTASVPMLPLITPAEKPDAPVAKPAGDERSARIDALIADHNAARNAWNDGYRAQKTDEEREAYVKEHPQARASDVAQRIQTVVDENARDAAALSGLLWIALNTGGAEHAHALERIESDHLRSDKLGPLCGRLANDESEAAGRVLERCLADNPNRGVQGAACYALAKRAAETADRARRLQREQIEKPLAEAKEYYGEEQVARLLKLDVEQAEARAKQLFARTIKEFGDVPSGKSTLGATAGNDLFEMEHLVVGKVAPEIAGEDLDGKALQLSDYRGKVVMLDFWGNW